MAKADDASSTTDLIWLRDARELAVSSLGSGALAEERLVEWITAKRLLWTCVSFKPADAADIGEQERSLSAVIPVTAYADGDPRFLAACPKIDWESNTAREVITFGSAYGLTWCYGALAEGIKVSRSQLLDLLPAGPHTRAPPPTEPQKNLEPELGPEEWLAWARKKYPKKRNGITEDYICHLHGKMMRATNVTKVWEFETFRRNYFRAVKEERHATFSRTV